MTEILAVFRSRSQAIDCTGVLKNYGVSASLINTPKEAAIGCGLSVKFSQTGFAVAKKIISGKRYSSFYGFFNLQTRYGRIYIAKM